MYITATLPLILLIIFFFRGVHLKGYQEGLALLFIPEVCNQEKAVDKCIGKAIRVSQETLMKPN